MARKKKAQFQNEYLVGYKTDSDELQKSSTVIALTPSEAEAKFLSATSLSSDAICNILKTGEVVII
jgi:hypothetical protein